MNRFWIITIVVGLVPCMDLAADEPKVPTTVTKLFTDFEKGGKLLGSKGWQGPHPEFKKLYWQAEDQ